MEVTPSICIFVHVWALNKDKASGLFHPLEYCRISVDFLWHQEVHRITEMKEFCGAQLEVDTRNTFNLNLSGTNVLLISRNGPYIACFYFSIEL